MSLRSRCVPLLVLLFCATSLVAQTQTLNPTIRVLPRATGPVPAECEEGVIAQPAQRVEREDIPEVRDVQRDLEPPPSRDLRGHLQTAHDAAMASDRESFRQSVAAAKELVTSYPPGAERTAAAAAVAIYEDLDRFWEYQLTSPIGSFFDATAEGGTLLSATRKYPRYEEFIRRQVIVDRNGNRFYPTRETRDFLLQQAVGRLSELGVRASAPRTATRAPLPAPVPPTQPTVQPPRPSPQPAATTERTTRQPQPRTRPSTARRPTTSTRITEKGPPEPPPSAQPTTVRRPVPVVTAPPVAVATDTMAEEPPLPPGVVDTTPVSGTIPPATMPDTSPTTETATAIATETDTTEPQEPAKQPRSRGIILPLMLILIGIGVLIVLFRASS